MAGVAGRACGRAQSAHKVPGMSTAPIQIKIVVATRTQSGFAPELLTTGAHRSMSSRTNVANSLGVRAAGLAPSRKSCSRMRILQRVDHGRIELPDNLVRKLRRPEHAEPCLRLEAQNDLADRWKLRKR